MSDNDWIAKKLLENQDEQMLAMAAKRLKDAEASADETPSDHCGEPVPVDPEAEKQAFAELLALLGKRDDGDAATTVVALDLDAFSAEAFTPTEADNPNPEI